MCPNTENAVSGNLSRLEMAEELSMLSKLYPEFTDQELVETKELFDEYLEIVWRIAIRRHENPSSGEFDSSSEQS